MKAAVLDAPGGPPETFRMDANHPEPQPGVGEAVLRVTATSVNYLDIWMRRGITGIRVLFPHICGCDAAGVVDGQRVLALPGISCGACDQCRAGRDSLCPTYEILGLQRQGAYAERVAVPKDNLYPIPHGWSDEEAAGFPLVYLTAWHALRTLARPRVDLLVWGASGGVGIAAVQVAKLLGARVVPATGDPGKADALAGAGADLVSVGTPEQVGETVRREIGGIDCAVDPIGGGAMVQSIDLLRPRGTLIIVGDSAGPEGSVHLATIIRKELTLAGMYMGGRAEFEELLGAVSQGSLRPVIWRTMPLDAVAEAHRAVEERRHVGKVVLSVG